MYASAMMMSSVPAAQYCDPAVCTTVPRTGVRLHDDDDDDDDDAIMMMMMMMMMRCDDDDAIMSTAGAMQIGVGVGVGRRRRNQGQVSRT
eukprot:3711643-Rhodomonas_salina.2